MIDRTEQQNGRMTERNGKRADKTTTIDRKTEQQIEQ